MNDYIVLVIFVILLIVSILLISGRGAFLIAGYNTSSKKEKSKYDEKKLCRVTGIGMLVISISMCCNYLFEDAISPNVAYLFPIFILVVIVVMLITSHVFCKRKGEVFDIDEAVEPMKALKSKKISMLVSIVVIGLVCLMMFASSVKVETSKTSIKLSATLTSSKHIDYDEIESIKLHDAFDKGRRTNGLGAFAVSAGRFVNDEFGKYTLFSNNECKTYIVMKLKDKSIVAFNEKTADKTMSLYKDILTKVK